MDDTGEERRLDPEAAAAPNRDRRGKPPIIEGEPAARDEAAAAPASRADPRDPNLAAGEDSLAASSAVPPLRHGAPWLLAAGLGGLAGAIVAAAFFWLAPPAADPSIASRLSAVEKSARDLTNTTAGVEKRLATLEASVAGVAAASEGAKNAETDSRMARADAAKALTLATKAAEVAEERTDASEAPAAGGASPSADLAAIDARVDKLENALNALDKSAAGLTSIDDRISKLEAALAAPKSEARAAREASAANGADWAAVAVVAEAVTERLSAGAPYSPEQVALTRLGADPAKVLVLAAFAEKGAPTGAALAADFEKIAPDVVRAALPKSAGGVMDRLVTSMSKVVKITPVGETTGDDPAALVSRIVAELDRGQIGAAMAIWARLPEPARQASQQWAGAAQARLAAEGAAQSLLGDAMAQVAKGDKP